MNAGGEGRTIADVLQGTFGFADFRPGQQAVIETLMAGGNVLAVMPTGSGKSLCYQVPAIARAGLTLVVSPLVALMADQVSALKLAGVEAETINSSRDRETNVATWRRVAAGTTKLLYLSPERLMTAPMLAALDRLPVALIAIDEAHCISQWGPAFRPEYEGLSRLKELFPGVPIAAFTATADEITRADIAAKLFADDVRTFVAAFDRPNIHLAVQPKRGWMRQLLAFLEDRRGASGIVYCLSRKKTEEAARLMTEHGIRALPYHAGMASADRARNQEIFLTEANVVMAATIAFGMGIDKADVRFVFHTDMPGSIEAYYQEIGRAGRDGAPAEARMLYGLDDLRMRRVFIEQEDSDDDRKRREHKRLDALIGYCEAPTCRRRTLLAYFGEAIEACGNCDTCLNPVALTEGTVEAQKALSAVIRTGQRFGAAHVIDVLLGHATEKVTRFGHDRLPTFGVGAERKKEEWRSILRQLVASGHLKVDIQGFGSLALTESGRVLLKGETPFHYRADLARPKAAKSNKKAAAAAVELSPEDTALLDSLKQLRRDLARERGVPVYVIFPDRALQEMARRRPRTDEEFATIYGVGQAKLRDFAEVFLVAIGAAETVAE